MALTKDRNTPLREDHFYAYGVEADAKIHAGALVVLDAGLAKPGAAGTGLIAAGRAEEAVDNTGGADGAVKVKVRRGTFLFKNSASDPLTIAEIGAICYVEDDETVARTSATNTLSAAGKVRDVETHGVWVQIG